jgi:cell cycle checkpoint protein
VELTLEKGLFTTYSYNRTTSREHNDEDTDYGNSDDEDDDTKFTVDLVPIVESLSLANKNQVSATHCTMIYQGSGYPFILIFEDSKMTERCEFSTYVNLDFEANSMGFELNQDEILMEGMIKADVLYDAFKDLKDINTEEIFIYASTQNQRHKKLAIIAKSDMGNSTFHLPSDRSILEKLLISETIKIDVSCFKYSLFSMALRGMKLSKICKFKRDAHILSLHLLSLFGNDLPKNYTGTVIDFKLLQLSDKEKEIEDVTKENQQVDDLPVQVTELQAEEEFDDVAIEVPVFI